MDFYESLHLPLENKKMVAKSSGHENMEIIVPSGSDKDSCVQDVEPDVHATASLNGTVTEEVKLVDQNLEQAGKTTSGVYQGTISKQALFKLLPLSKMFF